MVAGTTAGGGSVLDFEGRVLPCRVLAFVVTGIVAPLSLGFRGGGVVPWGGRAEEEAV